MSCCTRIKVDVSYLGEACYDHTKNDTHDWLDTGAFCCLDGPEWKRQKCWCKAEQWIETAP